MVLRLCMFGASLLPLLASADECSTSALDAGRTKWAAADITSYRFTLWEAPGAWSQPKPPVRVTVSKGKAVSARSLHYAFRPGADLEFIITELEAADVTGHDTIQNLLDLIKEDLQRPDSVVKCAFHPELGFPTTYWHSFEGVFDAESGFSISDFEVVE